MRKKWIIMAVLVALFSVGSTPAEAGSLKGERPKHRITQKISQKTKPSVSAAKKSDTSESAKNEMSRLKIDERGPIIEVGLLSGQKEVKVTCLAESEAMSDGKAWQAYKKGETLSVSQSGDQIIINGKKKKGPIYLSAKKADGAAFSVKGNSYRGDIKLQPSAYAKGVTVVNAVPMEEYLCGVVPSEVSTNWHEDALKAQAVAARTYAMFHRNDYREAGYDVTDDTRSQVYRGTAVETAATTRAIVETAGEIVTNDGKAIDAVFHSNGGGYTENSENVWGSNISYLRGVKEEGSSVVNQAWTKTVSLSDFQRVLDIGKLEKVELSKLKKGPVKAKDRGVPGRVTSFTVRGSKGKKVVTGSQIRGWFGLSSTLFDLEVKGKNVVFTGYGAGHGLGLSQWGAEAMAAKHGNGKDYYKTILTHYFTGTKVEKVY